MKVFKVISTAALALVLGAAPSVYAQKGQKEKGRGQQKERNSQGGGRREGRHAQHSQQPQHTQQARQIRRPQRTHQAQRTQRPTQRIASNFGDNGFHGNGNNGHHYGRIPDDRYRAHFGDAHSFRMIRPRMIDGYQRFQYSGYWFGYNEPWPADWMYNDQVYVEYVDNSYYLYNRSRPGIHITLNLF